MNALYKPAVSFGGSEVASIVAVAVVVVLAFVFAVVNVVESCVLSGIWRVSHSLARGNLEGLGGLSHFHFLLFFEIDLKVLQ